MSKIWVFLEQREEWWTNKSSKRKNFTFLAKIKNDLWSLGIKFSGLCDSSQRLIMSETNSVHLESCCLMLDHDKHFRAQFFFLLPEIGANNAHRTIVRIKWAHLHKTKHSDSLLSHQDSNFTTRSRVCRKNTWFLCSVIIASFVLTRLSCRSCHISRANTLEKKPEKSRKKLEKMIFVPN